MISPNKVFKLNSILFFIIGVLSLIYLDGFNKILGIFMLCYSYINMLTLRCKGKKKIKYFLLKVNIIVLSIIIYLLTKNLITKKYKGNIEISEEDYKFILTLLIIIVLVVNYISFKNFKF
jgi:hypothetical protein